MDQYQRITMTEVKRLYGPGEFRHWFSPGAMSFFSTVLPATAIRTWHGNYFVTKETSPSGRMAYTIRHQNPDNGDIGTLGKFHCYDTYEEARDALREHLREKEVEHV